MTVDSMATADIARLAGHKLTNIRQKATPEGRLYFVDLDGVEMRATEARRLCIQELSLSVNQNKQNRKSCK